jgi:hypothetical protein
MMAFKDLPVSRLTIVPHPKMDRPATIAGSATLVFARVAATLHPRSQVPVSAVVHS